MPIVSRDKKNIILNTGLNEFSFSKTANGVNFTESGILVRFNLFENNFQFNPWSFSGTTVIDDFVCFEGEAFTGNTCLELITSNDNAKTARMVFALNKVFTKAVESELELPCNGLGGIIYNEKASKKNPDITQVELLFLPENLFESAALNSGEKEYSLNQGNWQNKALSSNNAHIFTQAVIDYYALTKIFPFMKTDTQARQEDIIDSNFIKIEHLVNGIEQEIACNINISFNIDNQYEREKALINPEEIKKELGLQNDGSVVSVERKITISKEDFEKKLKQTEKSTNSKVMRKRFFKRYSIAVVCVLAVIAFASNFAYKQYLDSLTRPCAKNISSFEAVETFYSGFHQLDVNLMQLVAKGSEAKGIVDMVSHVYVTGSTRAAYEGKNSTLTPELYLTRPELMNYWVFGITDFKIDGMDAYNRYVPASKGEYKNKKKAGLLEPVPETYKKEHTATYNLVYSSGLSTPYTVDKCTAKIVCTYIKDQWYITAIDISHDESQFQQELFIKAYRDSYIKTNNPKETVKEIRDHYTWLPDDRAMDDAAIEAEEQKNKYR